MKKLYVILFLLFAFNAWALPPFVLNSGSSAPTPVVVDFCDSSETNLVWCWEVTGTNTTITSSGGWVAVGYDATASANGAVEIVEAPAGKTGYAIHWDTTADYYTFDLPAGLDTAGTIIMDVRFVSRVDGGKFFEIIGDSNNYVRMTSTNTDEFAYGYDGTGTNSSSATTTANWALDTWYTVMMRWRQGADDPAIRIDVNSNDAYKSSNTNLVDWATASSEMKIGGSAYAFEAYIKNIKLYDAWIE